MAQDRQGKIVNLDIGATEDVLDIDVSGFQVLWLELVLTVAALTAFTVEYKLVGTGSWLPMASAGANYTGPVHPVLKASGDLNLLAVGTGFLKLDITGVARVRIRAAGTSSVLNGNWSVG